MAALYMAGLDRTNTASQMASWPLRSSEKLEALDRVRPVITLSTTCFLQDDFDKIVQEFQEFNPKVVISAPQTDCGIGPVQ